MFIGIFGGFKAFKRAAESMEKLLDVTREELPDTMAAVRLSGMEISDLTMELSDLGLAKCFCSSFVIPLCQITILTLTLVLLRKH